MAVHMTAPRHEAATRGKTAQRTRDARDAATQVADAPPYDAELDVLVAGLGAPRAEDRWRAARALAAAGEAAVPALLDALGHPDAYVRRHAAEVLGRVGGDRATESLIGKLHDPSPLVRERAIEGLATLARPEASYALQIVLVADTSASVRAMAAEALGVVHGNHVVAHLQLACRDSSAAVRWSVARALGGHVSRRAIRPLVGLLADEDAGVRCAAADSLARQGNRRALEPLAEAMRDPDPGVRWHAADSLSHLDGARVVQIFLSALEDAEPGVRWRAASALGKGGKGYPAVVDALMAALGDKDPTVRAYTAQALGQLGDTRAIAPLRLLVDDEAHTQFLGKVGDIAWIAAERLERRARRMRK